MSTDPVVYNPPVAFMWTDLETTGLKAREGHILEVAVVLTDKELNPVATFESLVIPDGYVGDRSSIGMDDYVTKMHTGNGLLDALDALACNPAGRELCSTQAVGKLLMEFLDEFGLVEGLELRSENGTNQTKPYLAGSTVGFDRSWMEDKWPDVVDRLHYRVYDCSVLKTEAQMRYPGMPLPEKKGSHRGMADILESIELTRYLRLNLLVPVMEVSSMRLKEALGDVAGEVSAEVGQHLSTMGGTHTTVSDAEKVGTPDLTLSQSTSLATGKVGAPDLTLSQSTSLATGKV